MFHSPALANWFMQLGIDYEKQSAELEKGAWATIDHKTIELQVLRFVDEWLIAIQRFINVMLISSVAARAHVQNLAGKAKVTRMTNILQVEWMKRTLLLLERGHQQPQQHQQ